MVLSCLIVDDSEQFLEAARRSLDSGGLAIVGTATTPAEALEQAESLQPDVVLVDVSLGDADGFELTRELVGRLPRLAGRIVLISTRPQDDLIDLIAASPAVGFVPKSRLSTQAVLELLGR